jgi:hypothetical protein
MIYRKILFISIIAFLIFKNKIVAQSTFQKAFYHNLPGFQYDNFLQQIIVGSDHNLIVAGAIKDFIPQTTLSTLFKLDEHGSLIWYKDYWYHPFVNNMHSLIQPVDGNYLLVGNVGDSLGLQWTSYLMKTDTAGAILWSKIIPFSTTTVNLSELSMNGENIFCTGTVNNHNNGTQQDIYILKINDIGDIIWSRYLSNLTDDNAVDIIATSDSGCVFIGGISDEDLYYGKFNSTGNKLWSKRIVLPGYTSHGPGLIEQTADSGFLICIKTDSIGFGGADIILIKTDAIGEVMWTKIIGSLHHDFPTSMKLTTDGNIIISGTVSESFTIYSALSIKVDPLGNFISGNVYGLNNATRFSTSIVHDNYMVFIGEYNFFPPNGLLTSYFVKTDTNGVSGCYENTYMLSDSNITLTALDVLDSVVDASAVLVDIVMNVFDETPYIVDTPFCFVNTTTLPNVDNRIKLYPNPNNGNFNLQIEKSINGKIIIYNSLGEIMHEQKINKNDSKTIFIDKNLVSGFYTLKLYDNNSNSISTIKLIVQKTNLESGKI